MMDTRYVKPPGEMASTGDTAKNWRNWRNDFMIFLRASGSTSKPEDHQAYMLRTHIGKIGEDAIEKLFSEDTDNKNRMGILLSRLDKHFDPPRNEVVERYNFYKTMKYPHVPIEHYISKLQKKAETCNFGKLTNSLIRDKIIIELCDDELRKRLFKVENLNLVTLANMYTNHQSKLKEKQSMSENSNANKDSDKSAQGSKNTKKKQGTSKDKDNKNSDNTSVKDVNVPNKTAQNPHNNAKQNTSKNSGSNSNNQSGNMQFSRNCRKCDMKHPLRNCPAWGVKCDKCGAKNHFTYCCPHNFTNTEKKEQVSETSNTIHTNTQVEDRHVNIQGHPSAPPLYNVGQSNTLYPDIAYTRLTAENRDANTWSWIEEGNIRSEQYVQGAAANVALSTPSTQEMPRNKTWNKKQTAKKSDECQLQ